MRSISSPNGDGEGVLITLRLSQGDLGRLVGLSRETVNASPTAIRVGGIRVTHAPTALDPALVSGHLAWSAYQGAYLNDLLPLPYDEATLRTVVEHLDEVQDGLGRAYVIENPSTYVAFRTSTMTELEFLNVLVDRTGCRLLCDVSNVYLSGHNMGYDAYRFIDGLPAEAIVELHLGGFTPEDDEANPGGTLLVDTHADRIAEPVWDLYAHAVRRFGATPTLIEWDSDIPPFATLAGEAHHADAVRDCALETSDVRAC